MIPIIFSQIKTDEDRIFFENLYKAKHEKILERLKSQIYNQDDVEEVEQDVWKKLIENTDTLRKLEPYELNQYIVKAIHSVRVDYIRRMNKTDVLSFDDEREPAVKQIPVRDLLKRIEEEMAYEQLIKQLPSIVSRLTATEQSIYHYKFEMKESDKQIAQHLNITEVSVRKYTSRTKQSIFKLIENWAK